MVLWNCRSKNDLYCFKTNRFWKVMAWWVITVLLCFSKLARLEHLTIRKQRDDFWAWTGIDDTYTGRRISMGPDWMVSDCKCLFPLHYSKSSLINHYFSLDSWIFWSNCLYRQKPYKIKHLSQVLYTLGTISDCYLWSG